MEAVKVGFSRSSAAAAACWAGHMLMLLLEAADLERIVCRLNGSRYVRARVCVCVFV